MNTITDDRVAVEHAAMVLLGDDGAASRLTDVACGKFERTHDSRRIEERERYESDYCVTVRPFNPATGGPYVLKPDPSRPRTYHNLGHVRRVWTQLVGAWSARNAASAAFAIFHDWEFYSRPEYPGQSEEESLKRMYEWLGKTQNHALDASGAALVAWGILASARHSTHQRGLPRQVEQWLDADLAGLADPWETYQDTTTAVREETGLGAEDATWLVGRGDWLRAMLARPSLYYTNHAAPLEAAARSNMEREAVMIAGALSRVNG